MSPGGNGRGRRGGGAGDSRAGGPGSWRQRPQVGTAEPRDVPAARSPGGPLAGPAPARAPDMQVPRLLQQAAAWSWRLLLVAIVIYLGFKAASALRLVVLPLIAALLLTALLQPLTSLLRRAAVPSFPATLCSILAPVGSLDEPGPPLAT